VPICERASHSVGCKKKPGACALKLEVRRKEHTDSAMTFRRNYDRNLIEAGLDLQENHTVDLLTQIVE
jgi:hypothetical protein